MALQPLDLVVALTAVHVEVASGRWSPSDVQRALDLPWSSLDRSLDRLRNADILRGGRISRIALGSMLPALRYLFPLEVDVTGTARGVPTSYASTAFGGRIRYNVAQVWPDAEGTALGHAVEPLHPNLPAVARRDRALGEVFALIDAVRGGRVREVAIAMEQLRDRLALPTPYVSV